MVGNGATNWSVGIKLSFPAILSYFNINLLKFLDNFNKNPTWSLRETGPISEAFAERLIESAGINTIYE